MKERRENMIMIINQCFCLIDLILDIFIRKYFYFILFSFVVDISIFDIINYFSFIIIRKPQFLLEHDNGYSDNLPRHGARGGHSATE